MATVKDEVKEVLLGSEQEPQLSHITRGAFMRHARKDDASGELYLGEDEFVDAVAPDAEDYVSTRTSNLSQH
jgi:solute carrier family 25 (mitochondrial aspartate/glutamate transporter), member 12/13